MAGVLDPGGRHPGWTALPTPRVNRTVPQEKLANAPWAILWRHNRGWAAMTACSTDGAGVGIRSYSAPLLAPCRHESLPRGPDDSIGFRGVRPAAVNGRNNVTRVVGGYSNWYVRGCDVVAAVLVSAAAVFRGCVINRNVRGRAVVNGRCVLGCRQLVCVSAELFRGCPQFRPATVQVR